MCLILSMLCASVEFRFEGVGFCGGGGSAPPSEHILIHRGSSFVGFHLVVLISSHTVGA